MNKSLNYSELFSWRTLIAVIFIVFCSFSFLTMNSSGYHELLVNKIFGIAIVVSFGMLFYSVAKMMCSKRWIPAMASLEIDYAIMYLVLGCAVLSCEIKAQWIVYCIGFMFIAVAVWWFIIGYKIIQKERTWQKWRIEHGVDDMSRITDHKKYAKYLREEGKRLKICGSASTQQLREIRARYVALHEKQESTVE